jgi:hypothetical protein
MEGLHNCKLVIILIWGCMHTIYFDNETETRLNHAAQLAGKTPEQLITALTLDYLEDKRDQEDAESALKEAEETGFIPWEQIKAEHGL